MNKDVARYNAEQSDEYRAICDLLEDEINTALIEATCKMWHGAPVWFLDDNPVVGYSIRKAGVQLLFWSGWSFGEPALKPVGDIEKFKAAGVVYANRGQVSKQDLDRWLQKAYDIQWDYKNVVKNKGVLNRLK